jgi:hypothetical protein
MVDQLATAVIVGALLMAGWSLLTAIRDRAIGFAHLVGFAVVEVVVLAQIVVAVARMVGGERPAELATFIGYLFAALAVLPAGAALALMERTRWGSVTAAVAALVLPILVVRLQQVWHG